MGRKKINALLKNPAADIVSIMDDLGSMIRGARLSLGLTQTDVAADAGVTAATVCNLERGRTPAIQPSAQAILSALRLELVLLPGVGNPSGPPEFPLRDGWHRLQAPAWVRTYRRMVVAWVYLEIAGTGARRWRWGTFVGDQLRYAATAADAIEAADLYLD